MTPQEDFLKGEIISSVRRISVRVEGIENTLAKMDDYDESLNKRGVSCKIEAGAGSVIVDGHGKLVRVALDADNLIMADSSRLGARIVSAINRAQERASDLRAAHLDELAQEMW